MKLSVAPLSMSAICSAWFWYVEKLHFIFNARCFRIYIVPIFKVLTMAVSLDPSKNPVPRGLLRPRHGRLHLVLWFLCGSSLEWGRLSPPDVDLLYPYSRCWYALGMCWKMRWLPAATRLIEESSSWERLCYMDASAAMTDDASVWVISLSTWQRYILFDCPCDCIDMQKDERSIC